MHTVNRGGTEMTIPLNITHHIPPRLIGHLDEEGIMICDKMLKVTRLRQTKLVNLMFIFIEGRLHCAGDY